jgi:hypothetical protein
VYLNPGFVRGGKIPKREGERKDATKVDESLRFVNRCFAVKERGKVINM